MSLVTPSTRGKHSSHPLWQRCLLALVLFALTACTSTLDILRYELGVQRIAHDSPLGPITLGPKPRPDTIDRLNQNGFTAYLHSGPNGLSAEWYARGRGADDTVAIKSVSKVLVTAALGVVADSGQISVDTPILSIGGCSVPSTAQPLTATTLANMGAGFRYTENAQPDVFARPGWACRMLSMPVEAKANERFNYGTVQTHLLGLHLSDTLDQPLNEIIQDRVLTPLGVTLDGWTLTHDGDVFGGSEMVLHPRDMLAVGELFRDGGTVRGDTVLSSSFINTTRQAAFHDTGRPGIAYSWGWWLTSLSGHVVQFAEGYGGQLIAVVPEVDQVFVFTAPTGGLVSGKQHVARVNTALALIRDTLQRDTDN